LLHGKVLRSQSMPRCIERAALVGCWLLLGSMAPAAASKDGFNLTQLAPGVFLHTGRDLALNAPGHDDIANIGFVIGDKCAAVIDTGGSITVGRALRAAVRHQTSLPICYVINTHVHVDHVLGNAAFKNDNPSFVGHQSLSEAIARNREFFVTEYGADFDPPASADQVIGPDRLVEHEMQLDLGNRSLILRAWPKAHSDCDLTVYDEQTGTLWTGDLLFRERLPALDGSIRGWLAAIDALARMKVQRVVPGHGGATRDLASALGLERRYLQDLLDGVSAELAAGNSVQDAIEHVAVAEKPQWLLWQNTHPHNVLRAYQELEWE
jgi:quinoprotein relay system zinc metallohydrolase 2